LTAELQECAAADCSRHLHFLCYEQLVKNKHSLSALVNGHGVEMVVCTKRCYTKAAKEFSSEPRVDEGHRIDWDKDGLNGPSDATNSLSILLQWLMTEGNYARFCGNDSGTSKKIMAGSISRLMNNAGVRKKGQTRTY